jgi:hypothetical protein
VDPARFNIPPQRAKTITTSIAIISGLAFLSTLNGALFLVSLGTALCARVLPSRGVLARREFERRLDLFRNELETALTSGDRPRVERLSALQTALGLEDHEIALQREGLDAALALYALDDALSNTGSLPIIAGYAEVLKGAPCYFAAAAFFEKRGPDESGTLLFTTDAVVFHAALSQTRIPWSKVSRVSGDGRDLLVQRTDRQTPYRFQTGSIREMRLATYIASKLGAHVD